MNTIEMECCMKYVIPRREQTSFRLVWWIKGRIISDFPGKRRLPLLHSFHLLAFRTLVSNLLNGRTLFTYLWWLIKQKLCMDLLWWLIEQKLCMDFFFFFSLSAVISVNVFYVWPKILFFPMGPGKPKDWILWFRRMREQCQRIKLRLQWIHHKALITLNFKICLI